MLNCSTVVIEPHTNYGIVSHDNPLSVQPPANLYVVAVYLVSELAIPAVAYPRVIRRVGKSQPQYCNE